MKNYLKLMSFFILLFAFIFESFAIDTPKNFKLDSIKENSVSLSWDKVDKAFMYYIQYDRKSWVKDGYELETDFIETSSWTISNLEYWNTYYFSVIALNDKWEESNFSEELAIDLVDKSDEDFEFVLKWVNVVANNKLELNFSNLLDQSTNTIREFKIKNKNDELDLYEVIDNELNVNDSSRLFLTLDKDLVVWIEYELLVIWIISSTGKNIESWIDNVETFILTKQIIPETTKVEETKDQSLIPETLEVKETKDETKNEEIEVEKAEENKEETGIELNSAWPSGKNLTTKEAENNTLSLSKNNNNLPKTWPEHVLLIIFSLLIVWMLFVLKYKKA